MNEFSRISNEEAADGFLAIDAKDSLGENLGNTQSFQPRRIFTSLARWNGVSDHDFPYRAVFDQLESRSAEHRMHRGGVYFRRPRILHRPRGFAQGAGCVDHVIDQQHIPVFDHAEDVHGHPPGFSRAGPLLWFLSRTSYEFHDAFGGYVWVEEGRVVGNVTLNRLTPAGNRWQISNVAVAMPYRHQGIARQLMELALQCRKLF